MTGGCRSFLPSPLAGEGGAERSSATGEGFLRPGKLCENVLQYGGRLLQHVIVPVTRDSEPLREQYCFPHCVTLGIRVLTAVDFNDETLFETDKIKNEILKGNLSAKFELREPSISEQSPHFGFSVRRFATHLLGEIADAFGGWPMVWRLRHEPLTRRLTS